MGQNTAVDLDAFRKEVRAFFDEAVTPEFKETTRKSTSVFTPFEPIMKWQKVLYDKGWLVPDWIEEYGGPGWSDAQKKIYYEEYSRADAPALLPHAVLMLGPLICHLGTEEQKKERLPGMLSGEHFYAQGYSEPGAGSDLASLKTSAVSDGDDYIINGSKIWTSYAHKANRMFMLVRTSTEGKKQAGISFLLVDDMTLPGITVRPIVGLDGVKEQCEVFFEDVRVPKSGLVGKENEGWFVAKFLLQFERTGAGGHGTDPLDVCRQIARETPSPHGGMMIDDPVLQVKFGELKVKAKAISFLGQKMSLGTLEEAGRSASVMKILGTELMQAVTELRLELAGLDALPAQPEAIQVNSTVDEIGPEWALTTMPYYLNTRAATIYAGSNEIQRDIIAKMVLQIP